ncbi:MAG: 4Fe-4S ferredoxin [Bacteroidetes bacterium CG02_land_8_20_14_3_00_31_25]|nr:4Fe-4S dicluster domain-containing protein [Bacteroidota bacterium]PIV57571.1 MAG: 4Fe-4S ferredoxin [Bacteroidetes bacterium CG02_land_8_20_14_3_00_31_25]PIX32355.1 MAG: 4Fe-4S ferredoxin [Bacteroidetes bacterium CG_4_8_14_3_um_filter_31_14]PIY03116.1 MAG: 4Fe-4S ferredoxin [Bacteroidetes bacterium CG_4_10_14_3_um_filter_31_20]
MSINRRDFIKTIGIAGVTLTVGKELLAAPKKEEKEIEFFGVLYDSTRCVGCQTCETVCAETHGLPPPVGELKPGVVRKTDDQHRTVVNCYKTSKGEVFVKKQCMHCNEPACAAACLTQAMHKTKEGPIIWRGNKCMGCRYCMVSCPFDIPKFEYHSANPKIQKCDMCYDRQKDGKKPACVENCPAEALVFGTRRELIKEARKRIQENPDQYVDYIYGEHEAGGTGFLYLSPVPFNELGFNTSLQKTSYPELSKGFLYSVPSIFVLWPALLLGMHEATKNNNHNTEENE